MLLGIDVSTYLEQQRIAHPVYLKEGKAIDPFEIFKKQGVSFLRTRIWNDPYDENGNPYLGGTCDLKNFIELAKTLEKYEFDHLVDFHYSDFWVDPGKQTLPKAWKDLTFDELVNAVYGFTKKTLQEIKDNDIKVKMVQIGNEITYGFLWPHGRLAFDENKSASFDRFATLLKSGIKAAKEVFPEVKIVIHFEESFNVDLYRDHITNLLNRGVQIDILGTSYYPFFHHGFDEYFKTVDMVQKEFNIPVMNVETGFPFTTEDYLVDSVNESTHMCINDESARELFKNSLLHPTAEGQAAFVEKLIKLGKEHGLLGICYWEPLWIPGEGICWASLNAQGYINAPIKETRNEWANNCLFDYQGRALPSLDKYKI